MKVQATIKDKELEMKDLKLGRIADATRISSLEAKIAKQERTVKYWNERAPDITHCLKAFQLLVEHVHDIISTIVSWLTGSRRLHDARRTLIDLNKDVSSIDEALSLMTRPSSRATAQKQGPGITPASNGGNTIALSELRGESRLAQGSDADLKALNSRSSAAEALNALSKSTRMVQTPQVREAPPGKRKRDDSESDDVHDQKYVAGGYAFERGECRNAMPPPATIPRVVSNVHAYASPRHRGHINPSDRVLQPDVNAEHTVMTPRFHRYAPQNNHLTDTQSQVFEIEAGSRLRAAHDRHSTMESCDRNRQYHDTRQSVAETSHGTPDQPGQFHKSFHLPERGVEQRAPSTATLNRSYLPQQSSYEQRAPSTATLNRSYLPQQPSFEQRAPSTASLNRSYQP